MNPIYETEESGRQAVTVRPARATDLPPVLAIRNHAIEHGTALWTDTPQTREEGAAWLGDHLERGSAFVAEHAGAVVGFAVYGPWKAYSGFRHTVENSVYVAEGRHGLGIGSALLSALIASARAADLHVMIAGIEAGNAASIRLHERHGFEHAGTVREVGRKFDRWLDLTLMRLPLDEPPGVSNS
ncbi:GNAT family N-acetyltransferase [Streptomyces sp. NPDC050145]|uniref:GNAT family N-acetyltransferase n=1 Tax=Streptomyces sp. NPDC050145 TaxID=3365602 RepID=UPI0037B67A26